MLLIYNREANESHGNKPVACAYYASYCILLYIDAYWHPYFASLAIYILLYFVGTRGWPFSLHSSIYNLRSWTASSSSLCPHACISGSGDVVINTELRITSSKTLTVCRLRIVRFRYYKLYCQSNEWPDFRRGTWSYYINSIEFRYKRERALKRIQ